MYDHGVCAWLHMLRDSGELDSQHNPALSMIQRLSLSSNSAEETRNILEVVRDMVRDGKGKAATEVRKFRFAVDVVC